MTNDKPDPDMKNETPGLLVRHESDARKEKSTCGWRYRLVSEGDENVKAWGPHRGDRREQGALP